MEWIGTLQGSVNASIRAQVEGYVMKQNYEEGLPVKKGDLLFELDDRTYKAVLDDAKGKLLQAEANFKKSQIEADRLGPLVQTKAVSQQDYDNAVQANLANKAAAESAKATVAKAQLNLDFTRITSPVDGVAGLAKAQVGDFIAAGSTELTTVATVDPIKAYFTASEQEYLRYREEHPQAKPGRQGGAELEFELILATGQLYDQKGKFFASDLSVNQDTGAIRLCAIFPNPNQLLKPGGYARVRSVMRVLKDTITVPQRAVTELQGIQQIAVVTPEGKASVRTVKAGPRVGNEWVIEEGLKPGDKVIVEGIQKVRDGLPVSASPYEPPVAGGPPPAGATEVKPTAEPKPETTPAK
jgi:membrane fusion protein (multidrug efflux system)